MNTELKNINLLDASAEVSKTNLEEAADKVPDTVMIDPNKLYSNERGEQISGKQLSGLTKGFYQKAEETAQLRKDRDSLEQRLSQIEQNQYAFQQSRPQQTSEYDLFGDDEDVSTSQQNNEATQLFAKALSEQYDQIDELKSAIEVSQQEKETDAFMEQYPGATPEDYQAWQQSKGNDEDQLLIINRLVELKEDQANQEKNARREDIRDRQVAGMSRSGGEPATPPTNSEPQNKDDAIATIKQRMKAKGW